MSLLGTKRACLVSRPHRPQPAGVPAPWSPSSLETQLPGDCYKKRHHLPSTGLTRPQGSEPRAAPGSCSPRPRGGPPWGTGWGRVRLGCEWKAPGEKRPSTSPRPSPRPASPPRGPAGSAASRESRDPLRAQPESVENQPRTP